MRLERVSPGRHSDQAQSEDDEALPTVRRANTRPPSVFGRHRAAAPLRRQIALIAGGTLLIVLSIMIGFAEYRMNVQLERMAVERSRSATELLAAVRRQDTTFLKRLTAQLTTVGSLETMLEGGSGEGLSDTLKDVAEDLEFETDLLVLNAQGSVIASHGMSNPEIFARQLAPRLSEGRRIRDLLLSSTGKEVWITVSNEIFRGDRSAGYVIGRVDLVARVSEFFGASDSLAFLLPNGDVIVERGERPGLTKALQDCCAGDPPTGLIKIDGRLFTASVVPLQHADGSPLGTFVDLRDVTAEMAKLRPLRILSIATVAVVMLLSLGILMRSLRHALRPLGAVVRLLERLSAGKTDAHLKPVTAAQEIESLIESVEVFRSGIEARDRLIVLSEQLVAASRIQQSLLPREFNLAEGVEIFGAMEPAEEVAGDFFDCFHLPDGRIGTVIADVAGKGIAAALFASRASALLRANATVHAGPSDILAATNDELCERNPEDLFISVLLAILSPATGEISLANAGHCPPIVVGSDGACRTLQLDPDLVLGAFPAMTYVQHDLELKTGEMILFYSDGFDEARNAEDQLLGLAGALALTERAAPLGAEGGVRQIFRDLTSFAGGRAQSDDVTLFALRRTMPEKPATTNPSDQGSR